MITTQPTTELDTRFSSEDATPTAWVDAVMVLNEAEIYWLSTVRPDGRPHVTPLIAVWTEDALYFCTGPTESEARNLDGNAHCTITTGCNMLNEDGLDVVIEADAVQVRDESTLQRIADAYVAKYGEDWHFVVQDGGFIHESEAQEGSTSGEVRVYEATPVTAFGFGKGATFSQTAWRFRS